MDETADQRIGRNVAELRGDMSQQAVAKAMRERGWKWSQATVWAVEKGERPLRLAESSDLVDILGARSFDLLDSPSGTRIRKAAHKVRESFKELAAAASTYREARSALFDVIMYELETKRNPDRAAEEYATWLSKHSSPQDAVRNGVWQAVYRAPYWEDYAAEADEVMAADQERYEGLLDQLRAVDWDQGEEVPVEPVEPSEAETERKSDAEG